MTSSAASFVVEPERRIPVAAEVDVCVLGGSCTGVFAAVRAARLGCRVALVERGNMFGGTATAGFVNIWHSFYDTAGRERIIGGLSWDVIQRLTPRGAIRWCNPTDPSHGVDFNSSELAIELDALVREHPAVIPFLHARYCAPSVGADGRVEAVFIEDKGGRRAIRAKVFIDATGDGDLAAHLGLPFTVSPTLQPPTSAALVHGYTMPGALYHTLYEEHRKEFDLPKDSGWSGSVPGVEGIQVFVEHHVFGANGADAAGLTHAEMEARRYIRGAVDIMNRYGPPGTRVTPVALPQHIGLRETRRFQCDHRLTEDDVLSGRDFPDTIGKGSYRVDVHFADGGGFLFKYLDGTTREFRGKGKAICGRWRDPIAKDPTWYNIPYRIMTAKSLPNTILAGRMIDADIGAFGALRVMINLNQTGEAAGVAAVLAIKNRCTASGVDPEALRAELRAGGSLV